ncbi:CHAT domain-containing protein [Lacinutrix cladophorae]
MKKFTCYCFAVVLFHITTVPTYAQKDSISKIDKLRKLVDQKKIAKAKAELYHQIEQFKAVKQYDSLINYYEFIGSFILANNDKQLAIKRSKEFTEELLRQNDPYISYKALTGLSVTYSDAGDYSKAYETVTEAIPFVAQLQENRPKEKAELEYDLGYYSLQLSNYPLSKKHYLKSIEALKNVKNIDYVALQRTYNSIGIVYWTEAKMDSTKYYMNKSLNALHNAPKGDDFMNEYYRPALLQINLAIVSQAIGKNNEAIKFTEKAISDLQKFIDNSIDEQRKLKAKKSKLAAIDNLGVFYNEIGEFKRAEELINYAFNIKKQAFGETDPSVNISKIILAQAKINTKDLENAAILLDQAIATIEKNKKAQTYWLGIAYISRASVYKDLKDYTNASSYYLKGELLNRKATNNNFSKEMLEEMGTMSVFHAKHGDKTKALALAKEAYTFTKKGSFKNTVREFISTTNLANTYYILKNYEEAKKYSTAALEFGFENPNSNNASDSISIQFEKPRAISINTRSKYALSTTKDEAFLKHLLLQIEEGITILDQRKTVLKSHNDITTLMSQNQELFNFAKKIRLELFEKTNNKQYLMDVINLHESGLYNRIRSRLNLREDLAFSGISKTILEREEKLKNNIAATLQTNKNSSISDFFKASKSWSFFLDSLKQDYPKYYKMRYATIETPLSNLQNNIPEQTTVVRYLNIDKKLYALIVDKTTFNIVRLTSKNNSKPIAFLATNKLDLDRTSESLYILYQNLWKPIEDKIHNKNIIIIPDGALFNLSFESLTSSKATSFETMVEHSLLSKHNISYNYSLFLLKENQKTTDYSSDFIAFAPEFNDEMKDDYRMTITDSMHMDKAYLQLLPQPFSAELVKERTKLFNGKSFLNENASKQVFENEAKEHKIIHIGTHAESNNISPELSRLVFAKDASGEDNSLYTYEIYNQNLSSNLAVLTACETGKPTYQSGEGMISLAHAFNYAGSESILTSLWKIDEQSSMKIIDLFYNNISEGTPKHEALRLAKLDYIKMANGRAKHPQYWAGLILIGDASPIEIQTSNPLRYLLLGVLVLILLIIFMKLRKKA